MSNEDEDLWCDLCGGKINFGQCEKCEEEY